jgi:Haem-binding domain
MTLKLKWTTVAVVAVATGLQLAGPSHMNPPFDESTSLERTTAVPVDVAGTFAVACNDCHSNKTHWRWYTYVAPISWLTVSHVNRGRSELNFSVWGTYGTRMRETRLRTICDLSRQGAMPLPQYALIHPSAKLSSDQITSICEWTAKTRDRLRPAS